jgi:hypothetical protein
MKREIKVIQTTDIRLDCLLMIAVVFLLHITLQQKKMLRVLGSARSVLMPCLPTPRQSPTGTSTNKLCLTQSSLGLVYRLQVVFSVFRHDWNSIMNHESGKTSITSQDSF